MGELERMLRQLVGEQISVDLALVVAPIPNPFDPTLSPLVQVLIQPGNTPAEVRLFSIGQGPGQGLFFPVLPGAEILVIYPQSNPDNGIGIFGLSSGANKAPLPADGAGAILMSLLGVTIRSASGLPASAIVKGDLYTGGPPGAAPPFGGLATWVAALETFMAASVAAPTGPGIAAAAGAFLTTVGGSPAPPPVGTPSPFSASLTVSANPVTAGGPPFASLLNKVTD